MIPVEPVAELLQARRTDAALQQELVGVARVLTVVARTRTHTDTQTS